MDESTSVLSDVVGDVDDTNLQHRIEHPDNGPSHRHTVRHQSLKRGVISNARLAFEMGENGFIDDARSSSAEDSPTPDARPRHGSRRLFQDVDAKVEEHKHQESPERRPITALDHPLRARQSAVRRDSLPTPKYEEYSPQDEYDGDYDGSEQEMDNGPVEDTRRLDIQDDEYYRSIVVENGDTPPANHSESDDMSDVQETTPKQTITKQSRDVGNRQILFRGPKDKTSLGESAKTRLPTNKRQPISLKRHLELDYDDNLLAEMDYDTLRCQAFDYNPAQAESQSASAPPQGTLPDKLEHFLHKDQDVQASFFASMPIEEWDATGDWFLDRFSDVMQRLRRARKEKRQVVETFEEEIAKRQKAVQNKIHGIGQTLEALKSEGDAMMRGKLIG